jgi:hypothetical protein
VYFYAPAESTPGLYAVPLSGGSAKLVEAISDPSFGGMQYGEALYYAGTTNVVKAPLTGGAPVAIATIPCTQAITGVVADASGVYFTDGMVIDRVPLQGGPTTTVHASNGVSVGAFTLDPTTIYWVGYPNASYDSAIFTLAK